MSDEFFYQVMWHIFCLEKVKMKYITENQKKFSTKNAKKKTKQKERQFASQK